jgi:hypothetical protein
MILLAACRCPLSVTPDVVALFGEAFLWPGA